MIDPKTLLIKLNKNLNILQERAAKHGSHAPLDLLNQIDDHKEAIALVRQALTGELTQAELEEELKSLNLAEPGMTLGQRISNFFFGSDYPRQQRNRQTMLKMVYDFWVKGVLENSLHGAVLIELGMEERKEAIEHPWDMVLQTDKENRTLPSGTKIVDVFDEMGQTFLILGEPGSGKTTMLLVLARDLIVRAEQDPAHLLPVVFNLSSWTNPKQPIAEWLVAELNTKYNIPKKIAHPWVENDELLLLLDGLDEVVPKCREACVQAINEFCQEHLTPLVICSRVADYETLTIRLKLKGAVLLQPLTSQQVNDYLDRAGQELAAVQATLQYDPMLRQLTQSPLMLSIITLAYRGMLAKVLPSFASVEARRKYLFDTYVQQMFKRRGVDERFSPDQTVQWLAWLAKKMSQHAQSIFLIERMQPNWLQTLTQRLLYMTTIGLSFGLLGGLSFGLLGLLQYSENRIRLIFGLLGGLSGGLIFGLFGGLRSVKIKPVEVLKWSWKEIVEPLRKNIIILTAVLLLLIGLNSWMLGGLKISLAIMSIFGLLVGLFLGLRSEEIETRVFPNQGMWQSAKNAVIVGLLSGLVGGLIGGIFFGLHSGLFTGLLFGLIGGLVGGGQAAIGHSVLHFTFYLNGYIPWNYVRFLDYAAERIFLRKVGGGYIFVHRLLLEYFAALAPKQMQAKKISDIIFELPWRWKVGALLMTGIIFFTVVTYGPDIYHSVIAEIYYIRGYQYKDSGNLEKAIRDYDKAIELDPNFTVPYRERGIVYRNSGNFDQAIADFTKAIELDPNFAEAYIDRGVAYKDSGNFGQAIADFTKAIELDPNNARAYFWRGGTHKDSGNLEQAIHDHTEAIKLDPDYALAYLWRGHAYKDSSNLEQAIRDYDKAIELDTNFVWAYRDRGDAYRDSGNIDQAISDFTKAIELNPDDAHSYKLLGDTYDEAGNFEEAITNYTKAIELEPDSVTLHLLRGDAYRDADNFDQAIADYTRVIELSPDDVNAVAYCNRGLAYTDIGDLKRAIVDYTQAIELDPNYAKAYHNRGLAYRDSSDLEQAIIDYTKAIDLDPNNPRVYFDRGIAYKDSDNLDQAIANLTKAIELDPDNAFFYLWRGGTHRDAGNLEQAIHDHTRVIELDSNYVSWAYLWRGHAYKDSGNLERAILDYDKAIELDSNFVVAYQDRGIAYKESGNFDQAISDFTKAIELDPNEADVYYDRGTAYYVSGDLQKAIVDYTQAIELDPHDAYHWNGLCWVGSLAGQAADVIDVCERAVELAPDDGQIRDSRGLARALIGDFNGAVEDFEFYLEWLKENGLYEQYGPKREAWIAELKAGRNPFNEATLQELVNDIE